jgi:porin
MTKKMFNLSSSWQGVTMRLVSRNTCVTLGSLVALCATSLSQSGLCQSLDSGTAAPSVVANEQAIATDQVFSPSNTTNCAAAAPPAAPPFDGPIFERPKMTGDWLGVRTELRDNGFTFDVSSTQYYQGTAAGGRQEAFSYGGRDDYFINVDGEKAGLWKGLLITVHDEERYGDSANALTGAMMPTNLMLALPKPNGYANGLTAVKVTQFLSENMLVFGGKLNLLDGFQQQITGASGTQGFMNTAMIFNPVYARTAPYSTYGAGFAYLKDFQPIFSFAVLDTNNTPTTTGFNSFFNNGATMMAQLNLPTQFFEMPGHQGITGIYSTGKYTDLQPTPYFDPAAGFGIATTQKSGSWSVAYNFDQALYVSPDNPKKTWGVFGNLGLADGNPNPVKWYSNVGISGTGLFQNRPQDTFGVGYYYLGISDTLKDLAPKLLPIQNEQGVELYYNYAATPWFHVTPDIQVVDPFTMRVDTALVLGMRAKVDF